MCDVVTISGLAVRLYRYLHTTIANFIMAVGHYAHDNGDDGLSMMESFRRVRQGRREQQTVSGSPSDAD